MTRVTTVAIIGLGSRGLSVLERIVAHARRAGPAAGTIQVEVVDPRCDGTGTHVTDQPDYLLLNTICSGISMFPDACSVGDAVGLPGPSLYQWVTERGLRLAADGYTVGPVGREIRPTDFLPRRVLGAYLRWFLDQLRQWAPAHVRLRTHRAGAVDLASGPDRRLLVTLSDGTVLPARYAFLTTGHTPNRAPDPGPVDRRRVIAAPYPLPDQLARVRPGESVAIGGFGLSAMDLMSCLTVGRGGRFVEAGDQCRYLPSGREPRLLFYSRSGVPFRARPLVTRYGRPYPAVAFTTGAIDRLRAARSGPLDFDRDLLPLLLIEMRIAYRRCQATLAGEPAAGSLERELAGADGVGGLVALLDRLDARLGSFDAYATFDGSAGMLRDDRDAYQKWLAEVIKFDLAEGVLGFTGSPVKAALDVLRALRDTIRYAVDFQGLTDRSRAEFHRRTVPLLNRAVVGPQFERHSELLALLATGTVQAPFGPAPELACDRTGRWTIRSTQLDAPYGQEVDWLCSANVAFPAVARSASPLLTALHRSGWIRPHHPADGYLQGIDVCADQHPIDAHGRPEPRVWVLGPLCEGVTYYNNALPWTESFSRPAFDAHRCVAAMFAAR
ncbi:MAG: FAD/NAD(P)-binding protein [Natronosporangium sp.]